MLRIKVSGQRRKGDVACGRGRGALGFTLLELVVVMALLLVLSAMAYPALQEWKCRARYREAAGCIAAALRDARARAVTFNRQHRVEFDLKNDLYRMSAGNRALNSTASSYNAGVILDWTALEVDITANAGCDYEDENTKKITFNPKGTSNDQYICVLDDDGNRRFRIGIPYATTGQVVVGP